MCYSLELDKNTIRIILSLSPGFQIPSNSSYTVCHIPSYTSREGERSRCVVLFLNKYKNVNTSCTQPSHLSSGGRQLCSPRICLRRSHQTLSLYTFQTHNLRGKILQRNAILLACVLFLGNIFEQLWWY